MPPASNMVSPYGQQSHLPPLLTSPPVQMQGTYPSHSFYQAPPNLSTQSFYTAPAVNPGSKQTRYPRPPPRPSNRPILCYRCGEYGHYQSKCALPEGSPPCRHCPEAKDHYSKDCPKQRASTSTASNQGQSDFTFPKINMISVSTIPHAAPSTHVVIPQDTKQTVEEPVGVLTRSQRAALGLKLPECPPSSSEVQTSTIHKKDMKTRQQNLASEYEESEEAERLDSESSDDSEYEPASQENSSDDQPQEDSPSASRGTGATDKISTSNIPRPSNALSDNPIQVVFHLNPPKHALSEVFSPQQLSQLGLQSLAQVDLMSNMVTPGKLGAMFLTFPKLNNKILYIEHLGRAMGIQNMPIPLLASKTYSRLTPREIADACDELLFASHPDFQRHLKIFHILHYYFLMRFPVVNSLSLPSPRLYDMFCCLCHSLPYPFHVTMFKALQNRTKRFKTQRKGKAEKFHCYAAPIMQWMAQLILESDTPGSSQPPATDKGKRPLPGRGVQTRGGHSKRTKVSRDSAANLSSLPFSQSHHTGSLRTQTSSLISPTPITAPAGRTIVSSTPQTTPQMTSPIATVGPAPSTIVHQTGLTAATTISMEPSTSTPTPRTSAPQGISHFMSRADKLLQMERSATLTIADAINTIHGAQKMHAVTYESMYEELLDTHQRVYDRDVEKAVLFDRNRILNRQVQDLKEVISSLNLQLREAQEQLQQKSVVTTMVCERCAQMELTVTTIAPVTSSSYIFTYRGDSHHLLRWLFIGLAYSYSCLVCQRVKYDRGKAYGLLQPLPIPTAPWESIAMYFIFGLSKTSSRAEGIWTIVDRFSKQAHFIPVRKQITAEHMAKIFLVTVFKYYGMPRSIVSDRDPRMTGLFWRALWQNLHSTLQFSSSYHPQADGQSEIVNSALAYNNTIHSSTGKVPFEIVEGARKPPPMVKVMDDVFEADKFVEDLDLAYQQVQHAIQKAQEKQKKAADKHRR
ncbi:hypothetical protein L7F22_038095 [Adiantum nelumboides]|nr:hypothetical protein [Adiantum nelumboides]